MRAALQLTIVGAPGLRRAGQRGGPHVGHERAVERGPRRARPCAEQEGPAWLQGPACCLGARLRALKQGVNLMQPRSYVGRVPGPVIEAVLAREEAEDAAKADMETDEDEEFEGDEEEDDGDALLRYD